MVKYVCLHASYECDTICCCTDVRPEPLSATVVKSTQTSVVTRATLLAAVVDKVKEIKSSTDTPVTSAVWVSWVFVVVCGARSVHMLQYAVCLFHSPATLCCCRFSAVCPVCLQCFVPLVLWRCLLGGRKGVRPVKNWVARCWRGYLSGARCRLAYGPADSTATHWLLLQ